MSDTDTSDLEIDVSSEKKLIDEKKYFDYIIIGSGPGAIGAIKAINENNQSSSILVMERGPSDDEYKEIKLVSEIGKVVGNEEILLEKETVPQKYCNNLKIQYLDINCFGGGFNVNGLVATKGDRNDYKGWVIIFFIINSLGFLHGEIYQKQ